ncbi:MAG: ribosome small subunit-dependent GTPase A [Dysgonamonadaceae bacterium]|nr:ribosome small subunit-dependent GTPase A [Dysgonamonadaceae bacterium]
MKALVNKNTGSIYQIRTEDGRTLNARLKGNYRLKNIKSTNPIAVGDVVEIEETGNQPTICHIHDRRNYFVRKPTNLSKQLHIIAANIDQIYLITTINYPVTTTTFIDRFLATAEAYRIPAAIIINKTDLHTDADRQQADILEKTYNTAGYETIRISAEKDIDLSYIHKKLQNKITLLSGHSGSGKSTIINRLLPGANQKTGQISECHNKGTHTTTYSEMLPLPYGGYIIDTPGIKGFGTFDMNSLEISHYFPEIFNTSRHCRFADCTHRNEPGCAVMEAVENHIIAETRYKSYLNILEDCFDGRYRR